MTEIKKPNFWIWYLDNSGASTRADVVYWWERRRWAFNVYVGCAGVFTWLSVITAGNAAVKPGVDFEEPLAMIFGPPMYALLANICYTMGWVYDGVFFIGKPRHRLLQAGFWFSVGVTAVPGLWAIFCWLRAMITGKLLD